MKITVRMGIVGLKKEVIDMRCVACDRILTDIELIKDYDFCGKCLFQTFGDSRYAKPIELSDDSESSDE